MNVVLQLIISGCMFLQTLFCLSLSLTLFNVIVCFLDFNRKCS